MEHLDKKTKITIMVAIMAAMLFAALNMTIVGTSLPKIVADIGGMPFFNWAFTIYMLTSSITAILVGKLSDIYGRKIFILAGICIFLIGSLLCGFSTNIIQLIIFRGIQGFGGGMIMSSSFTTIGDLFPPRERGRWQGLMSAVFGVSSLFGPTLGGLIVDNMDWSWVFWIFLPVGLIAFLMIWKLYPPAEKKERESIDYGGSFVLAILIFSLLLGFSLVGEPYDLFSLPIISLFAISFISLILFIYIESKVKSPVVPLFLFKERIISVANGINFLVGIGMFTIIMYVPFYVQGVLGRTATTSGLVEMVMTLSMVTFSALCGQWMTKTGKYKMFAIIGLAIMSIGFALNTLLHPDSTLLFLIINLVITGIGLGIAMPIYTLVVQNAVEHKYLGVATATSQLSRQLGGTVGVAIMGFVMSNKMSNYLTNTEVEVISTENEEIYNLFTPEILLDAESIDEIKSTLPTSLQESFHEIIMILREALNAGLVQVFLYCSIITAIACSLTFLLKEIPLRTSNENKKKSS